MKCSILSWHRSWSSQFTQWCIKQFILVVRSGQQHVRSTMASMGRAAHRSNRYREITRQTDSRAERYKQKCSVARLRSGSTPVINAVLTRTTTKTETKAAVTHTSFMCALERCTVAWTSSCIACEPDTALSLSSSSCRCSVTAAHHVTQPHCYHAVCWWHWRIATASCSQLISYRV